MNFQICRATAVRFIPAARTGVLQRLRRTADGPRDPAASRARRAPPPPPSRARRGAAVCLRGDEHGKGAEALRAAEDGLHCPERVQGQAA